MISQVKKLHSRPCSSPIAASANALKTAVKAMFHDVNRKKNILLFGLGEEDNKSLKEKASEVLSKASIEVSC